MQTPKLHQHHHTLQFVVLLLLLCTGYFSFVKSSGENERQFLIIAVTGTSYAFWGIFHHLYDHDLNWKIVVEYGAIALFGISVLWALLSLTG